MPEKQGLEDRFWSKVNILGNDDCWEWQAAMRGRYGCFGFEETTIGSHRVAWFLTYGYFSKVHICHKCDNPKCCNPNHLFEGTDKDNMIDASKKGRLYGKKTGIGEKVGSSKLKNYQVKEIKNILKNDDYDIEELSIKYGVGKQAIKDIRSGRTWSWLK